MNFKHCSLKYINNYILIVTINEKHLVLHIFFAHVDLALDLGIFAVAKSTRRVEYYRCLELNTLRVSESPGN